MFKHFVITRFNLKSLGLSTTDKNGVSNQTDLWLKHRFELFERFCLPSIIGQTRKNFLWLVLFDESIRKDYQYKMDEYAIKCPEFRPCYFGTTSHNQLIDQLRFIISSYLTIDDKYLITTRIDNDDAMHSTMIETVQMYFLQDNYFLNFPWGYQFDVDQEKAYLFRRNKNHFISRVESIADGFQTVMYGNHSKIDQLGTVYNVNNNTPMWIEVVHSTNIVSIIKNDAIPVDQIFPDNNFSII